MIDLQDLLIPALTTLGFTSAASLYYFLSFQKKELAVSIVLFGMLIFSIVHFVSFEGNIGLGIGLLGILSIIRLRNTLDNLTDIGFIFFAITIGLINAAMSQDATVMVMVNLVLTALLCILTSPLVFSGSRVNSKLVLDTLSSTDIKSPAKLKLRVKKILNAEILELKILELNELKDSVTVIVSYVPPKH